MPPSLPAHMSYSQYNTYVKCPRSWYLGRLVGGEERQSWYIPIGTVVHSGVEAHLKGEPFDLTRKFYGLVEEQMRIEPDLSKWLAGGPEQAPIVGDLALERAVYCYEKALTFLDDVDVWEIEFDATGKLPWLEVPLKAYIDILGEHKKKGPVILDWKSGSTKPGNFQLETYYALLDNNVFQGKAEYNVTDWRGRYIMLAPGAPNTRYVDFKVTPGEVGKKYQEVYSQMKERIYKANAGFDCRFCFQAENCLVNKGMTPRALYFDKSAEDGYPF